MAENIRPKSYNTVRKIGGRKTDKLPKECKKLTGKKYQNRKSPPYSANKCKGLIMDGQHKDPDYDYNIAQYISIPDKNNVYRWKLLRWMESAKQYYAQFPDHPKPKYSSTVLNKKLTIVKNILKKRNIFMLGNVGWESRYFIDWAWADAKEKLSKIPYIASKIKQAPNKYPLNDSTTYASFMFYSDNHLFASLINGKLYINHIILKKDIPFVDETFKKVFGNAYEWNKRDGRSILLKIDKIQ